MANDKATLGFRIVGNCAGERRLIDWSAAFAAYAACDERATVHNEGYLSAFTFANEFDEHLNATRSTRRYEGRCCAKWLWFDIDADDLGTAANNARRLCAGIVERYSIDPDELLIFFSGSKGYHVGLRLSLLGSPAPSANFHKIARRFAVDLAERLGVTIDAGVYDKVRAFRAPNSLHPKTDLHKRRLTFDELLHLKVDSLVRLASKPEPFDVPNSTDAIPPAIADWQSAADAVEADAKDLAAHRTKFVDATLNRQTREFIRDGATPGDRHRLLFSAAANLAEFGCPAALAHALLSESALDSGLQPSDVRRQIDCGLDAVGGKHGS